MKIGAVNNYQTHPHFTGESKKSNTLKNTAGAAAIALAAAIPAENADAQYYYPPIYPPITYTVPSTPASVPKCFIYGDTKYSSANKSTRETFDEIDANGNENGVISAKEVIRTERNNWNRNNMSPFTTAQMRSVEQQFNALSRIYNEDESDPETMNYREYRAVMEDYSEEKTSKKLQEFINILAVPYLYDPFFLTPPPHHHHHHHHRHTPPPNHRHW